MSKFEKWYEDARDITAESGWKAGAQSKQAEIDELLKMVKKLIDNTVIGIDDDVENQARDLLKGTTNEQ